MEGCVSKAQDHATSNKNNNPKEAKRRGKRKSKNSKLLGFDAFPFLDMFCTKTATVESKGAG